MTAIETATTTLVDTPSVADRSRERIEMAVSRTPFCDACGSHTLPVAHHGQIWLECAAAREPKTILRRILALEPLVGHTHEVVVDDLPELLAA